MNICFKYDKLKPILENKLKISEVESDIDFTNLYLTKNGKPIIPVMGEFHFSRFPNDQWEDEIVKMKAGGITVIATYLFWIHHEETEGNFNFSGDRDIKKFLSLCEKHNMLVVLRIGPWCHGEVVYGGFPKFIFRRVDQRSNSEGYLEKVKIIYKKYYENCKDYFYQNNSVVIGIQLENEYGGRDKDHLDVLRDLAVEVGFKLPIYTVTAWPLNGKISNRCLPMFGEYPERPWEQSTRPLKPGDSRFKINRSKIVEGIGTDLLKQAVSKFDFEDFPYSTCELGCGNQVTEHRRPIISKEDAYSLLIIQLAQGVNFPGYYMYHGGRNPVGGLYQESRKTFYPNNCPVSSYDFQSPLSEYGYPRESYHYLKLVHYFLASFQESFAKTQPVFSQIQNDEIDDKVSVRIDENKSGYVFVNNYQRLYPYKQIRDLNIRINDLVLPAITVPSGVSMFYPFNFSFGGKTFGYITAQPICKVNNKCYFFVPNGVKCNFTIDGDIETLAVKNGDTYELTSFNKDVPAIKYNGNEIYFMTHEDALNLWHINGNVLFSNYTILPFGDKTEKLVLGGSYIPEIFLVKDKIKKQKYDYYLYSHSKKEQYEMKAPKDLFDYCDDCIIELDFIGNVAQVYCQGELVADLFNYNGILTLGLKRFKKQIQAGEKLVIKISTIDRFRRIYLEHPIERCKTSLTVKNIIPVYRELV